jgi:hypothetical protein
MDRLLIDSSLAAYLNVLSQASSSTESLVARETYQAHEQWADRLRARWQGGESHAALEAALYAEWIVFRGDRIPGPEAESVGRAFGDLCRTVGVRIGG